MGFYTGCSNLLPFGVFSPMLISQMLTGGAKGREDSTSVLAERF